MKMLPSSANSVRPPMRQATVLSKLFFDTIGFGLFADRATRAIRVLHHAGACAALAEGRLLVARNAGNVFAAKQIGFAKTSLEPRTSGSTLRGTLNSTVIRHPTAGAQIVQHRARGVAGIDVHGAAGEFPDEPGVDGAKRQLALPRQGARTFHMLEQPHNFAAENSVDHETRFAADGRGVAGRLESVAVLGRGGLPDDGVMIGRPVSRSQSRVVSRWLVMPWRQFASR